MGETCNLTALSGAEVIYLDRVETAFPLRLDLRPGSRVPLHCSASGKLFLAHLPRAQRERLLDGLDYQRFTAHTLADRDALEAELERIRREGHSVDAEEFIDGLVCVAVPVRDEPDGPVRCAVALQAPAVRMSLPARCSSSTSCARRGKSARNRLAGFHCAARRVIRHLPRRGHRPRPGKAGSWSGRCTFTSSASAAPSWAAWLPWPAKPATASPAATPASTRR